MAPAHSSSFSYDPDTDTCYRTLDHIGFPGYRCGDDGSVWSCWTKGVGGQPDGPWRRMNPSVNPQGYLYLSLSRRGERQQAFKVHRLVLTAFVGPCPGGMETRHLNGDPADNRLVNLVWGTKVDNGADARRHGTHRGLLAGADGPGSKLTETQVREIRRRYAAGGVSQRELAAEFGVHQMNIHFITSRKTWKDLD